jgi:transposase InsO family protein
MSAVQSTAYANAYVERLIGSIRRECLDHVIVLSVGGLQRVLAHYVTYYMNTRTHLSLGKDAPVSRRVTPLSAGRIVEIPQVNGLHHRYERAAA